jgi:class 3 adenylate cyclase
MLVCGITNNVRDHAEVVADLALEVLENMEAFNQAHGTDFQLRIGISSGTVVAGVIGRTKLAFDVVS